MTTNQELSTRHSDTEGIRVLHLIDSLALGGAERMAVNLCNALATAGCEVHLCATRCSGPLKVFLGPEVTLLTLEKKRAFDTAAIRKLKRYIHDHSIQIIHAHSSSFFMGRLMKFFTGVRLVWHDHNGKRPDRVKENLILKVASWRFDAVICVNDLLKKWAIKHLKVRQDQVSYLPNFPGFPCLEADELSTLSGNRDSRIVSVANLRYPKDHMTLIRAMSVVNEADPDAHLLLVGQDLEDDYSDSLKKLIRELGLDSHLHLLGGRTDIAAILSECSIGVLSSSSEGLPVSLLEYGLAGLAVVCTDVGECSSVLGHGKYGRVVPPASPALLADALIELLSDEPRRTGMGELFREEVGRNYSSNAVSKQVVSIYQEVINGAHN